MDNEQHSGAIVPTAERLSAFTPQVWETELTLPASTFRTAMDNRPRRMAKTWAQWREVFLRTFRPAGDLKKHLPALCPATFAPGATRSRAGVLALQFIVLDFDNAAEAESGDIWPTGRPKVTKVPIPVQVQPQNILDQLQASGVACFMWTTWSRSPEWMKFRVVIPLVHPVPPDLWAQATEWALRQLGLAPFRAGLDIPVLRDTARLHFLPGAPDPSAIRRWEAAGAPLSIPLDALQAIRVPEPPRMAWQVRVQAARRATGGHWYRKYPVDFRTLRLADLMAAMGVKVGSARPYGCATKWRTWCPWAVEHAHGLDDDSGVIIHAPGRFPVWRCVHAHHAHLGLQDVVEAALGVGA